eukprot:12403939-Karenia_brevis.AAC.1
MMNEFERKQDDLSVISAELYSLLVQKSEGKSVAVIMNVETGNGLEAWRRFSCEFGAKSDLTDEGLLNKMVNWPRCTNLEQVPAQLEQLDLTVKDYIMRTQSEGTNLGKSFVKSIIMRIVPESIKKTLDAQTTPVTEPGIREYIKQQLEILRRSKPLSMDIGLVNENADTIKIPEGESDDWKDAGGLSDLDAMAKGKGKGKNRFGPNYTGCWKCGGMNHTANQCMSSQAKIDEYQAKRIAKGKGKQQWYPPYPGYGKAGSGSGKGPGWKGNGK